jgi:hypothetical protein
LGGHFSQLGSLGLCFFAFFLLLSTGVSTVLKKGVFVACFALLGLDLIGLDWPKWKNVFLSLHPRVYNLVCFAW